MPIIPEMLRTILSRRQSKNGTRSASSPCSVAQVITDNLETQSPRENVITAESLLAEIDDWGMQRILLGMGCFFGAEAHLSALDGVIRTSVGKATGTNITDSEGFPVSNLVPLEVVDVIFDPNHLPLETLLSSFFEHHHCFLDMEVYTPAHVLSCIFVIDDQHRKTCESIRAAYSEEALRCKELVLSTVIGSLEGYVLADESLQGYHRKHPAAIEPKRANGLVLTQ